VPTADPCPHRPPCPGCPRFGEAGPAEEARRAIAELCAQHALPDPEVHATTGLGHRHRARLAVRGRARSPKIGLFESGSHRIVDTPRCAVHHPAINHAVAVLKQVIHETRIAPYADTPHRGALRYVQLVVERATERVQVVLVGNGDTPDVLGDLPDVFANAMGERLQALFFNAQRERSNVIMGDHTIRLRGEEAIVEALGGVAVHFPPAAFGQNHLPLFERAIERIHARVPNDAVVFEAYCGVGAIGLGLLARGPVRFNERSRAGLDGLGRGLATRMDVERGRATVLRGAAGERLDGLTGADVVIVDPPRKGLDEALLEALVAAPPSRLIYLACGLPRLLAEVPALTDGGRMRLTSVELFDFFPFTGHVETLVVLDRDAEHSGPDPAPRPSADEG